MYKMKSRDSKIDIFLQRGGFLSYSAFPWVLGWNSKPCSFSERLGLPWDLTRHDGPLAVEALAGALVRVALRAQQALVLGSKRLFHQRVIAFGTVEACFMPVSAFVTKILRGSKYELIKCASDKTGHWIRQK